MNSVRLRVLEIPRVEGHLEVELFTDEKGVVKDVRVAALEGIRLIEKVVTGLKYRYVPSATSRICGICGYAHTVCSVLAIERALGIEVREEVKILRDVALRLNHIDSHLIHIAMMLPDVIQDVAKYRELLRDVIVLRSEVATVAETLFGNRVHPVTLAVGGAYHIPRRSILENLLKKVRDLCRRYEELLRKLLDATRGIPKVSRYGKFMALKSHRYSVVEGIPTVNASEEIDVSKVRLILREEARDYSTAKFCFLDGEPCSVGAFARLLTNERNLLCESAKKEIINLRRDLKDYITMNLVAQVIEVIEHLNRVAQELPQIMDIAGRSIIEQPKRDVGVGFAVVEAPRGILLHEYTVRNQVVSRCNIITPTVINLGSIERTVKELATGKSVEEIKKTVLTTVRSYDPCVSCAVHVTKLSRARSH